MKSIFVVAIISLSVCTVVYAGWGSDPGTELYLLRSGIESHRAVFDYAGDCDLIAKTMNKAEPNVNWFCK